MPKLSTMKSSGFHRIMIYGPPKSGKSLLAGKLAEKYHLIWFDLENGHEVLFQLPEAWQENIDLIQIPDTSDYFVASETCINVVRKSGVQSICDSHGKINCQFCKRAMQENPTGRDMFYHFDKSKLTSNDIVVFDSATQLTSSIINYITKGKDDDYKLEFDDWGSLGKKLDVFYSYIQNAPYNVIVISHEINAKLEEKGKAQLVPVSGTRNYSRNVGKFFDEVIYCQRKNRKHTFASSTTYDSNILTGSRHNVRMEDEDNPSLLKIFDAPVVPNTPNDQAKRVLAGLKK